MKKSNAILMGLFALFLLYIFSLLTHMGQGNIRNVFSGQPAKDQLYALYPDLTLGMDFTSIERRFAEGNSRMGYLSLKKWADNLWIIKTPSKLSFLNHNIFVQVDVNNLIIGIYIRNGDYIGAPPSNAPEDKVNEEAKPLKLLVPSY